MDASKRHIGTDDESNTAMDISNKGSAKAGDVASLCWMLEIILT
jgi:hypothetical protein